MQREGTGEGGGGQAETFRNSCPQRTSTDVRAARRRGGGRGCRASPTGPWLAAARSDSCSRLAVRCGGCGGDRPIISLIHKLCARRSLRGGRSIAINLPTNGGAVALGRQAYLKPRQAVRLTQRESRPLSIRAGHHRHLPLSPAATPPSLPPPLLVRAPPRVAYYISVHLRRRESRAGNALLRLDSAPLRMTL